jgi:hypothetical protein
MSYGPLAVPTLGGGALIALAALLALFAFFYAKQNQSRGGNLLTAALVVTALSSASGGVHFINSAEALAIDPVRLDSPSGGTVPLSDGPNTFENGTPVKLRINGVNPAPGCTVGLAVNGGGSDSCVAGKELAPEETCSVFVNCGLDT